MKIVIHSIPPSANRYLGNSHSFNIYRREKEKWHWLIKAAIKEKPEKPIEKAVVRIRYYFKDARRHDPDNYAGKMLLDPLVREGILKDDSFAVIRLELAADVDKSSPRTVIEIEEVRE